MDKKKKKTGQEWDKFYSMSQSWHMEQLRFGICIMGKLQRVGSGEDEQWGNDFHVKRTDQSSDMGHGAATIDPCILKTS